MDSLDTRYIEGSIDGVKHAFEASSIIYRCTYIGVTWTLNLLFVKISFFLSFTLFPVRPSFTPFLIDLTLCVLYVEQHANVLSNSARQRALVTRTLQ